MPEPKLVKVNWPPLTGPFSGPQPKPFHPAMKKDARVMQIAAA